jgi:tetratricopeptide (TPR) repeat protein
MKTTFLLGIGLFLLQLNAYPINDTSGFYHATVLFRDGKIKNAQAELEKIASLNPKYAPVYFYLGMISQQQYDFAKAETYYKQSLKLDSANASVYIRISSIKYYSQQTGEARKYIEKALKIDPRNARACIQYADILSASGETEKAKNQLNKAARIDSNAVLQEAIRLLMVEKKPQSALFFFNILNSLYPLNVHSYYYSGFAFKASGDPTATGPSFKKALENCQRNNPVFDTVYTTYFDYLMSLGKYEEINFTCFEKCGEEYAPAWYYNALANYALKNRVAYLKGGNKYFELTVKPYPASLEGWLKQELAKERSFY